MKNNKVLFCLGAVVFLIIISSIYVFYNALGFIREKYIYLDTIDLVTSTAQYTETNGTIEYSDGTIIEIAPSTIKRVLNFVSDAKKRVNINNNNYDVKINIDKSYVKIYYIDEDSAYIFASFGEKYFNYLVRKNSLVFYFKQIKEKAIK